MTGRLTSTSTSSLSSDIQPIDLAKKSHATRVAETGKGGSTSYVHFSANASASVMNNLTGVKNENNANVPTVALVSRHPPINNQMSTEVLNLAQPTCNAGFSSGNSSGMVRSVANSTSTSLTMVSASSTSSPVTVPSGYHIPRGAAVVANMTASRSQNLTSIVKTSSQPLGISNSSANATSRTGLVTQRVVPISSSSWINRSSSSTPVVANKVSTPQTSGRATITTARSVQSPVMPSTTYHSGTVKPGAIVAANIRSPGSTGVRIGTGVDGIRPHAPKGLQISHPVSHVGSKYIGTGVVGTVRGVNAGALSSSGNSSSLYSPTSTLVTSLASSGTTITPHPGNRNQVPPSTLRITSASTFAQVPSQSNPSLCGISLTPPSGAILSQHQTTRSQLAEHHLPIKTPIVRAPYAASPTQSMKGNSTTLPAGTQISFTGSKMIAHPTQGQSLAVTQISNVTNLKPGAVITTAQSASNTAPFQSRTVTTVGPNIGKIGGPAISMTKVIPKAKIAHNLGTSTGISSHSPGSTAGCTTLPVDSQPPHTSVFLHRTQHSVPGTTGGVVTQSDRIITTVPQYSISTPYYLEPQNQGSFPVSASLVPYSLTPSHYIPTTVTSGTIQVGGNVVSSNVTSSDSSLHQGTMPIMKANSSPRPSILRKRAEMDGSPLKAAKNLTAALNIPISSPPSPKRPDSRGNGNASSGSTTISANSSPGMQILEEDSNVSLSKTSLRPGCLVEDSGNSCLVGGSSRPLETSLTNFNRASKTYSYSQLSDQYLLNIPQTMDGVSPRKKPRKQQLMGNELQESPPCEEEIEPPVIKKRRDTPITQPVLMNTKVEDDDKHQPSWTETPEIPKAETPREVSSPSPEPLHKKPHMSLINSYRQSWKPRHNHFARHSDLRPKEEKKRTVNEIASQKMAMQRVNGWKVMHISGQVEDLVDLEGEVANRLRVLLKTIEKRSLSRKPFKDFDKDVDKLSELVKANIQRSIIIKDQMADAKFQMSRLFEHKDNVVEILTKYSNKRILRKKDKI